MIIYSVELGGAAFPHALGKIVCVGRNYAAHAAELNNPLPTAPLLFMKPASAVAALNRPLLLPAGQGAVHHELEMAILLGAPLRASDGNVGTTEIINAIAGIGIALDLTLRDVQDQLKRDGHPWERAKAFDGAYPLSGFIDARALDLQNLTLQLWRNGTLQQNGHTGQMLFSVLDLIAEISRHFSLQAGDVISTGTPAGVGPLVSGDELVATLGATEPGDLLQVSTTVL
jgi:2-keto-4-pentenoate hydratase/2-oxohepta-3-ene-1,7-dioic acid hydratase in catechol pathway